MTDIFTTAHVFSASNLAFYTVDLRDRYAAAATWPDDPVAVSDADWETYIAPPPEGMRLGAAFGSPAWVPRPVVTLSVADHAAVALSNPVVLVSCPTQTTLNGYYAADPAARGNITGIAAGINGGLGLPSGTDTFNYFDTEFGSHDWSAPQFLQFARQVMVYIYALSQVAAGIGRALPSNVINITG